MKKKITFLTTFGVLFFSAVLFGQSIDFTLKYNTSANLYEVYGRADFTETNYFVGGGTQISIVLPSSVPNEVLNINTINGGLWADNSQAYNPIITPDIDYHGIASNGALMDWTPNEEILLFTFSLPDITCVEGIRIYENESDPSSDEPSMHGTDFQNYFANALTFENRYRSNYENAGTVCGKPVIEINPIITPINTEEQSCANIINTNLTATHTATICQQSKNGNVELALDTVEQYLCLNYQPNEGFIGMDSVCVEVCDNNGNCFQTIVQLIVFENTDCGGDTLIINGTANVCQQADITLYTDNLGNEFAYQWTNANGEVVGQGDTIIIASNDRQAISPFQVTRMRENCTAVVSNPFEVVINDFSTIQIDNQNGEICPGGTIILSVLGGENLPENAYNWYNTADNELIAIGANPSIENIQSDLTLRLEVDYNNCKNTELLETTINLVAKLSIANIPRTLTVCPGEDVLLQPTTDAALGKEIRYFWKGPNDFNYKNTSSTDSFPLLLENISPEQAGAYSLEIISPEGCKVDSRSIIIEVRDELMTPFLTASGNIICREETLLLTATLQNEETVNFEWFLQDSTDNLALIAETTIPSLIIEEASGTNSGNYLVRIKSGNCRSGFSNIQVIEVLDNSGSISLTNSTDSNNPACIGGTAQLNAPFFEGATYEWHGPAGYTSDVYNPIINILTADNAGEYFVVIHRNDCAGIVTAPTIVYVQETVMAPFITGGGDICEGETVRLALQNSDNLRTIWYHGNTGRVVDTTFTNQLTFPQISAAATGNYYAVFIKNGCVSEPSNEVNVNVLSTQDLVVNVGNDLQYCSTEFVNLQASVSGHIFGQWTSLSGASIENPETTSTIATDLVAGQNIFVYTIQNSCGHVAKDTVTITILQTSTNIANAGQDLAVCESNTANLSATAIPNTSGSWTQSDEQSSQGIVIQNPNDPNTAISGLVKSNIYRFNWTLSTLECLNVSTDEVLITVDEIPEENAVIDTQNQQVNACGTTQAIIQAEPALFSVGRWFSPEKVIIDAPLETTTTVYDLPENTTPFIWMLSNGACKDFSSDTVFVYRPFEIEANSDQFEIDLNDSLILNIFDNDKINDLEKLRFVITKYPDKGTLKEDADGTLTYIPKRNYFGADNFRYKLCDLTCESVCDTAVVNLLVNGRDGASGSCFIPNVLTPNNDGVNDNFVISCLNEFPDAEVKIFNRWGDVVHSASPYLNDWEGTFEGKPLPAGTYYYYLQLTPDGEPIQSFFSIFR